MPRAKRTLSKTDASSSSTAPPPKRTSFGEEKELTEAIRVMYLSNTKAQLSERLKQQGLPSSGNKAELVLRLLRIDVGSEGSSVSSSSSSSNWETESDDEQSGEPTRNVVDTSWKKLDWITICRPFDEIRAEMIANDPDYDYYADDERRLDAAHKCGRNGCMCRKDPQQHPEWKWVVSRRGYEMIEHLHREVMRRDQDFMGVYNYNDFSGYGFQEVVENHLASFNKEMRKKSPDPLVLWAHIEGFAHVLPGDGPWLNIDDCQRLLGTFQMVGMAVIMALNRLDKAGLFAPASAVLDLPLMLGLCLRIDEQMPRRDYYIGDINDRDNYYPGDINNDDELDWHLGVVEMAKLRGVHITGLLGIEKQVKEWEEELEQQDEDEDEGSEKEVGEKAPWWEKVDWKSKFAKFVYDNADAATGKFSGDYYVIDEPIAPKRKAKAKAKSKSKTKYIVSRFAASG